jgi:hypothetical protein
MSNLTISVLLIILAVLDLFTLGNYGVIDWLYNYGKPVDAVMVLVFVPMIVAGIGMVLLLRSKKL